MKYWRNWWHLCHLNSRLLNVHNLNGSFIQMSGIWIPTLIWKRMRRRYLAFLRRFRRSGRCLWRWSVEGRMRGEGPCRSSSASTRCHWRTGAARHRRNWDESKLNFLQFMFFSVFFFKINKWMNVRPEKYLKWTSNSPLQFGTEFQQVWYWNGHKDIWMINSLVFEWLSLSQDLSSRGLGFLNLGPYYSLSTSSLIRPFYFFAALFFCPTWLTALIAIPRILGYLFGFQMVYVNQTI